MLLFMSASHVWILQHTNTQSDASCFFFFKRASSSGFFAFSTETKRKVKVLHWPHLSSWEEAGGAHVPHSVISALYQGRADADRNNLEEVTQEQQEEKTQVQSHVMWLRAAGQRWHHSALQPTYSLCCAHMLRPVAALCCIQVLLENPVITQWELVVVVGMQAEEFCVVCRSHDQ